MAYEYGRHEPAIDPFPLPQPMMELRGGLLVPITTEENLPQLPPEVMEQIGLVLGMLNGLRRIITEPTEEDLSYEYFVDGLAREEVYQYSMDTARYVIDNDIETVILADRSARPMYVGIKECLKALLPDDAQLPDFKFINPKGFKSRDLIRKSLEKRIQRKHYNTGDKREPVRKMRRTGEILEEFEESYPDLHAKKTRPALLMDTCLHSGTTTMSVGAIMELAGFKNVHLGVVHDTGECPVRPDFTVSPDRPIFGCVPFGADLIVQKTYGSTHAVRTKSPEAKQEAILIRREIRRIVKDRLARDGYTKE